MHPETSPPPTQLADIWSRFGSTYVISETGHTKWTYVHGHEKLVSPHSLTYSEGPPQKKHTHYDETLYPILFETCELKPSSHAKGKRSQQQGMVPLNCISLKRVYKYEVMAHMGRPVSMQQFHNNMQLLTV